MPDVVEIVRADHRKVEALFDRYHRGDRSVVDAVCTELVVHTAVEEKVLYPALADVPGGDRLRRECEHEHHEVSELIERLQSHGGDHDEADHLMAALVEGVAHHVEEEEQEVLPKMAAELGARRMAALGANLLEAKRDELAANGHITDLSKEELYQLARALDVPGRSEMSKDQLIKALRG